VSLPHNVEWYPINLHYSTSGNEFWILFIAGTLHSIFRNLLQVSRTTQCFVFQLMRYLMPCVWCTKQWQTRA